VALAFANFRYWLTVAPVVREQLCRWRQRGLEISDPVLNGLVSESLRDEGFNAEVAATLATLAPRRHRDGAVEAIVALEVLYDYLDTLVEQPLQNPLRDGCSLFQALIDAVDLEAEPRGDYHRHHRRSADDGYLEELVAAARSALARLPAADVITTTARQSAARCAEAQVRAHAVASEGSAQLRLWAMREAAGTALEWRGFLAGGAASVLTLHALIAAAADVRTTSEQAARIDTAYLSIAALSTLLDSLVDYEDDVSTETLGYIRHFEDREALARTLGDVARHAVARARELPHAAHHLMTLVGVVAYYTSAPSARDELAVPIAAQINRELRPLITPTLAVMRTWRLAKRIRARRAAGAHGGPTGVSASTIFAARLPVARYVAIIADGNGRWARARGLFVTEGHRAGADTLKARLRDAAELGVRELTLYSFSTENWSRPAAEVQGLIAMLAQRIASETPELHRQGVRMRFIGRREGAPSQMVEQMRRSEALTAENRRITLFIAFNYGGRAEIVDAALRFHGTSEREFRDHLYAPDMHDPDLIIRTGGERRLSNYLLWQSAESELVFREELWPDFTRADFEQSLAEYRQRGLRRGSRAAAQGAELLAKS
jgi:undecaprenyl diphosphate synthase